MKKKYINPELTIVTLNLERLIAQSIKKINTTTITGFTMGNPTDTEGSEIDADTREVIQTPDPWDNEW